MYSKEIENYKKKLRLNRLQREVLVGILLGDACLETQNSGRTYRLKIEQSEKHKAYLDHLYKIFENWMLSEPHKRVVLRNGKESVNYAFSTVSHGAFRFYAHLFYQDSKKKVPVLVHKFLTERSIAYWFMDDGSIKSKQSKGVIFNTQAFCKEDVEKLVFVLQNKFQLQCWLRKQKEGYQIYVSGESFGHFHQIVSPFIIPSMQYKIPGKTGLT